VHRVVVLSSSSSSRLPREQRFSSAHRVRAAGASARYSSRGATVRRAELRSTLAVIGERAQRANQLLSVSNLASGADAMSKYVLPELDYDYSALEPHISGRIMELHHGGHHAGYVKNANATLERMEEARATNDMTRTTALEKALAFHLSGHVLHSIFWRNLAPQGGGKPQGELAAALDRDFGGFDKFKEQFNAVASTIMGSGWAALVWEPLGKRLMTTQIYDHQSNLSQAGVPLMVLDAWEHAYYLQYENRKTEFFDAAWNLWNWQDVAARFENARHLDMQLPGTAR
jgi:Fe-Mn family superoxide dismutase